MNTVVLALLLICTAIVSWWLVGRLIGFLHKHKIVDTPNHRSLHKGSVPRGGGLVIIGLTLVCLLVLVPLSGRYWVLGGLSAVILAWSGLSWWDDRKNLSPRRRLMFQLLFTLLTIFAFGYINTVQISVDRVIWLSGFGAVLTFIGVIWLANLFNFMDGMDGLAATQTIIAGITLAFWFWQAGDQQLALTCMILAAASYGFLLRNWQPARIFMGDVGSITIGAFFATLIIFGNTRYQIPVVSFVLLLGVFVFDASVTIFIRAVKREKIWLPHRRHFYQRLAATGMDHSRIVIMQTVLMLLCSIIASLTVLDRDRIGSAVGLELILLIVAASLVLRLEKNVDKNKSGNNGK